MSTPMKPQQTLGGTATSDSSWHSEAAVPPCAAGLEHGVIYYEHPHAPSFDPRLRSKPERMEEIKAIVPTLDFSKLRGGHRKPGGANPQVVNQTGGSVALAALKQVTASGAKPKPSAAAQNGGKMPTPKPPQLSTPKPAPPKPNMTPQMPSFAEMMAMPSFGTLPAMPEAKSYWPSSQKQPPPPKPASPMPAAASSSGYTPWGTRKPTGTTSAAEMLRQLEEAEALAETPASAVAHMGANARRMPPSSQKQSQQPSKRPPRAKPSGGIDFLARLEKIEKSEDAEEAVTEAAAAVEAPPPLLQLPLADAAELDDDDDDDDDDEAAEDAELGLDFAATAPPSLAAIVAQVTMTPHKSTSTAKDNSPAALGSGADAAGYNSSDGGASISSSIMSEEPACTGGANVSDSSSKVQKRVADLENAPKPRAQRGLQLGQSAASPANAGSRVSPARSTLLQGNLSKTLDKQTLMEASRTLAANSAARPRQKPSPRQARQAAQVASKPARTSSPMRNGSPMRAGSPAAAGGALARSMASASAGGAGAGNRFRDRQ